MKKQQSEKDLEQALCEAIEDMGGHAYKFTSPGRRAVPDRVCVLPKGLVAFVEVKAPGKYPTPAQERELNRLGELDHWAFAFNDMEGLRKIIKKLKGVLDSGR